MFKFFSIHTFFFLLVKTSISQTQIANYVSNGSFERLNTNSVTTQWDVIYAWQPMDSVDYTCNSTFVVSTLPGIANAPYIQGYQFARTGNNYNLGTFYCATCGSTYSRFYPRNRLKQPLVANKVYCAKYYVVNANVNGIGIDSYGIHFADSSLDTVSCYGIPLIFLNPQIQNNSGNYITDTLNWVPITGTFVATGNEKYMVLGNFNSENATGTVVINSSTTAIHGTDVCMDDVSVIELNLPAYAGLDKSIIPGDSVYIGRESDFAIDPGCIWYKLPNTTTAIDTISGMWVKPTVTTTFVVKQTLDCSSEKWDTVVVFMDLVGIEKYKLLAENIILSPNPAQDQLQIQFSNAEIHKFNHLQIFNSIGQVIREEEIDLTNNKVLLSTKELPNGIYTLTFNANTEGRIVKKLVISK